MTLFNLLNLAPPFDRRFAVPMLNIRFVHPAPDAIGCTIERLATGQYFDASAWSKPEPKPTPLVRDASPAQDRARLDVPADDWPPGDYAITVYKLAADGTPAEIIGLVGYSVPVTFTEMRFSMGVAGH